MENSIFFAKLLGPYFIIVSAGILFNLKTYHKIIGDFCKNSAILYFSGILALLFGLLVVLFHNVWVTNWTVIITIFGWLGIIKGIWLILLPNTVAFVTKAYQQNVVILMLNLLIIMTLGIFLTVMGF